MSTTEKPDPASLGGRTNPEDDDNPFAGILDVDGTPVASKFADPDAHFRIVWIGPDQRTILVNSSDDLDTASEMFGLTEPGVGRVFLFEAGDEHPLDSKGAEIERKRENEEATEPERQLDVDEDEEDEASEPASDQVEKPEEATEDTITFTTGDGQTTGPIPAKALFDAAEFDDPALLLETEDGETIDEILVKLSGSLVLDRKSPEHVQVFRELQRGRPCVVEFAAHITTETTDEKVKGEETVISSSRKIAVWRLNKVRVAGQSFELPSKVSARG